MKNLIVIPILLIFSYIAQLFFPWWIVVIAAFICCFLFQTGKFVAFTACLLAIFALWSVKAYLSDSNFDVPMSEILGGMFGNISSSAVFLLTGLVGGIMAGLGGLLGSWTRQLMKK
jgi:hypothetical protein